MRCVEKDCDGEIDLAQKCGVTTCLSCKVKLRCFPCSKCGRLHWEEGTGVFSRIQGLKAFLVEGGPVYKDTAGKVVQSPT